RLRRRDLNRARRPEPRPRGGNRRLATGASKGDRTGRRRYRIGRGLTVGGAAVDDRTLSSTGAVTWRGRVRGLSIRSSSSPTAVRAWKSNGWATVVSEIRCRLAI